jgi:hypothetical protein
VTRDILANMVPNIPAIASGGWLLIGFSFGLTPDGSPGAINSKLAEMMHQHIVASPNAVFTVSMQWEIFDAFKDAYPDDSIKGFVVAPPFEHKQIKNPEWFKNELRRCAVSDFPPLRLLAELLQERLLKGPLPASPAQIDGVLQRLWRDRRWWSKFAGLMDFDDLRRPEKGVLGQEKRRLPFAGDYKRTKGQLREYQAMRVNRLILETIFPPEVLPRAEYLNTTKVAQFVKGRTGRKFAGIVVFAHPRHFGWCSQNVVSVFGVKPMKGWRGPAIWDTDSAQVWTRSADNYRTYNRI